MLAASKVTGFIPTTDGDRARAFYENVLGLQFLADDSFAVVMEANGSMLRLVRLKEHQPAPYTVLGWEVTEIGEMVHRLSDAGVAFHRYPFLDQDEQGIWTAPGGAQVAWFSDPDGNVLSVSQHSA